MKIIKNILSLIISMVLMFSLVIAMLTIFLKVGLFNETAYTKAMEKENLYENLQISINDNLEYALLLNNIPTEYAKNIISTDEVKVEVDNVVKSILTYVTTGKDNITPVNTSKYQERIKENIERFIRENGLYIEDNQDVKNTLATLEDDMTSFVKNDLEVVNLTFIKETPAIKKVSTLIGIFNTRLYLVLLIIPLILIALIGLIWGRKYKESSRWVGYGFLTSGTFVFLVFISGYLSRFYNNIIIGTPYLKEFVVSLIEKGFLNLSLLGLASIILGIVMLVPKMKQQYKKTNLEMESARVV